MFSAFFTSNPNRFWAVSGTNWEMFLLLINGIFWYALSQFGWLQSEYLEVLIIIQLPVKANKYLKVLVMAGSCWLVIGVHRNWTVSAILWRNTFFFDLSQFLWEKYFATNQIETRGEFLYLCTVSDAHELPSLTHHPMWCFLVFRRSPYKFMKLYKIQKNHF